MPALYKGSGIMIKKHCGSCIDKLETVEQKLQIMQGIIDKGGVKEQTVKDFFVYKKAIAKIKEAKNSTDFDRKVELSKEVQKMLDDLFEGRE